jgi:hypothetical protein
MDDNPYEAPKSEVYPLTPEAPRPVKFSKLEVVGFLLLAPVPWLFYRFLELSLVFFFSSIVCLVIGRVLRPPA